MGFAEEKLLFDMLLDSTLLGEHAVLMPEGLPTAACSLPCLNCQSRRAQASVSAESRPRHSVFGEATALPFMESIRIDKGFVRF